MAVSYRTALPPTGERGEATEAAAATRVVADAKVLLPSPLYHTVAVQCASATSTVLFYPFDLLRVRFMSQDGTIERQHNRQTYHSIRNAFSTIYREEGLRALFRGCHVAVLGSVVAWGVYMYIYRSLCYMTDSSSYLGQAGISTLVSLTATFVSSPIWLIKTRMQIEDLTQSRNYATFRKGLRHIVKTTGFCSLWRGTSLQLTLVIPNAFSYPTYDLFKRIILRAQHNDCRPNGELSMVETTICSTLTKTLLVLLSHPLMFLKVRLQDQRSNVGEIKYTDIRHSLLLILKREGPRGMFRGLTSSLLHSLPRSVVHYILYEKLLGFLCRHV